jgi:hypothetical protein
MNETLFKTEEQFQAACFQWFDRTYPQYRKTLFAVPNGGLRDKRTANVLQATGTVPGVSDLIFVLPVNVEFIELKLPGKTQQPDQIKFEAAVTKLGHNYTVIYSLWNFQEFVKSKIQIYYGKV